MKSIISSFFISSWVPFFIFLNCQFQFLASMIPTITTNSAPLLWALSICSFIDGVHRDVIVLIQAFLASAAIGNTCFFASSPSWTKNRSSWSLFLIDIPLFFRRLISLSTFVSKPVAGISFLRVSSISIERVSYLQPWASISHVSFSTISQTVFV